MFDADWSDTAKLDYTRPELRDAMMEVYDHGAAKMCIRDRVWRAGVKKT